MANDNFYGYSNKKPELDVNGNIDMAFEKVNPYEFKKGMYFELNALGCPNLHSSTPEDREKATTKVLKNLGEMADYYSQLENYESETRNMEKAPSFKKFVETNKDQAMKEVDKEFKGDKMEKIKESIDAVVKQVLNETKSKNTNKMTKEDLNIMIAEELEAYMKNMEGTEEVTEADEIEVDVDSDVEGGDAEDTLRQIYDMLKGMFDGEMEDEVEDLEDELEDEVEDEDEEEVEELDEAKEVEEEGYDKKEKMEEEEEEMKEEVVSTQLAERFQVLANIVKG
jgi:hypothetical protein